MPQREVVRHPETGEPAFKVVTINYERAEEQELQRAVASVQTELDAAYRAKVDNDEHVGDLEARLREAKSELESVQRLVGEPAGGVAEPAPAETEDGTGGEVADAAPAEAAPDEF